MAEIVVAPSKVLSEKAKEVKKIDTSLLRLIGQMKEALLSVKDIIGVGLAAPQIGSSLRIFVMKPNQKAKMQTIINPKIIEKDKVEKTGKKSRGLKLEGCLSLPNIWGTVGRSPKITISYLDESGKQQKKTFQGFNATIIQHEMDHLDGVLFPKKVIEQKGKLYKSHKNKKGEDEFELLELP